MKQRLVMVLVVVALVISACGGAPAPTATPLPPPTPTKATAPAQPTVAPAPPTAAPAQPTAAPVQPTATPAQPTATKPPAPTATPVPAQSGVQVSAARSVDVSALWYGTDDKGQPTGGTSKVRITAEPNASKQFRVGFFEGEVAGSGPMWRASGWVATIMAAMLTGFDPAQTQVSFDVGGRIDGPSAGGLMTIGVLAALRGDKVRDDAAMTGTINPDGTIGPVGGIQYKIDGAAKAGKKLVLIPIGRMEGRVDLIEHGKRQNVEVREVTDIYTAYEALTGKVLSKPSTTERPQVSGVIYDRMNAKYKEWLARYQEAAGQFNALPDNVKQDWLQGFLAAANDSAARASRLASQGAVGGAYGQSIDAAVYAVLAAQTGRILELYVSQGKDGAIKQLQAGAAFDTKVTALADRLKAEQPKSLAGASALVTAYGSMIEGLGFSDSASQVLSQAGNAQSEEDLLYYITTASLYLRLADLKVEIAKDALDMVTALGGAPLAANAPVTGVAEFFRRASEANLTLFDTVVLEPVGKSAGVSMDVMRGRFAARDFTYAQARSSLLVMPRILERYFGGGDASAYAQLGGALSAYSASTGLIAKYYSLDAQLDDNLDITAWGKERALIDTLDLADEQARGSIAFLRKNNVDPALFIVTYESSRLAREGGVADKMTALTGFWDVYIYSRALAYLGGFAGK